MNKIAAYIFILSLILITSCKPDNTTSITTATEKQVLADFAGVLANPNYQDIQASAGTLNTAVLTLQAAPTDANLDAAQQAWRDTRAAWENCEGYLFGPVEDNNYDPSVDTWPLDKVSLDSLMGSSNGLSLGEIDALSESLKGFHAIEYVLFGEGGTKYASQITPRQMNYVVSLSQSLYNVTTALRNSWDPAQGNYTAHLVNAGDSVVFNSRQAAFVAMATAMANICEEVGTGKMEEPLGTHTGGPDSTKDESRFSHNSTTDFRNNITGVLNAYMCQYKGTTGKSLHTLVATSNISLDNKIKAEINAAISSFDAISPNYELAIYTQPTQIANTQHAIATLQTTIEDELIPFLKTNIKD